MKQPVKRYGTHKERRRKSITKRYNKRQKELHRYMRIGIGLATALISLTAFGGGMSMILGSDEFAYPIAWLQGTPFKDYTIPGSVLAFVVGGSCLIASITNFSHKRITLPLSMVAGVILSIFVMVEAYFLRNVTYRPIEAEIFYFFWGVAIFGFSTYLYSIKHVPSA